MPPPMKAPKDSPPLKTDCQMSLVRFSPCGKLLAAAGHDGTVHRWDVTGRAPAALPPLTGHHGWVTGLAFSGDCLFSADSWGRLTCRPYAEPEPKPAWSIEAAHDGWARRIAVSPDGATVASCGRDRAVRLWAAADGKKISEFSHPEDVLALAFHPDGRSLVTGSLTGAIRQWDIAAGKVVRTVEARAMYRFDRMQDVGGVRCLAFDRDGKTLFAGGAEPRTGGFVQATPLLLAFDWPGGDLRHTIKGASDNEGFVHDLLPHPDGFVMAVTSGQPGQGRLYFQKPGDEKPTFVTNKMQNCHSLDLHPDGRRLAVAATNPGSSGNGRPRTRDGSYPGNWSPIYVWELSPAAG